MMDREEGKFGEKRVDHGQFDYVCHEGEDAFGACGISCIYHAASA